MPHRVGQRLLHDADWLTGPGYVAAGLLVVGGWTWFPIPLAVLWGVVAGIRLLLPAGNSGATTPVPADRPQSVAA